MAIASPLRRCAAAGALACLPLVLAGCGGAPDRAEFVDKITESIGVDDLLEPLAAKGVDEATARKLTQTFVECQYDALKAYPDLLEKVYDDPGNVELAPQIDALTGECVNNYAIAMSEAATPTTVPETVPQTIPETVPETIPDTAPTTVPGTEGSGT